MHIYEIGQKILFCKLSTFTTLFFWFRAPIAILHDESACSAGHVLQYSWENLNLNDKKMAMRFRIILTIRGPYTQ